MHFIENIVEPVKLLLTWQSSDKQYRTRYTVGELDRVDDKITLKYFSDSPDFHKARALGFEAYPAFPDVNKVYDYGVLDALMRRLPPKSRGDYNQYLEGFRIKTGTVMSDFALLGYTGAKLPNDGFAIINPFTNVISPFEFLVEAAGYRYLQDVKVALNQPVSFKEDFDPERQEPEIKIYAGDQHIGFITRALIPSFRDWMNAQRIQTAWVEKQNGNPGQPIVYLYVRITV